MTKKITVTVPDNLHRKLEKWRPQINISKICQDALTIEIDKKERFQTKLAEEKSIPEIWENADLKTRQGQYTAGKEIGFVYAKIAPYRSIKKFEKYVVRWDEQDPKEISRFYHDLDIGSVLEELGLIGKTEDPAQIILNKRVLTFSFDHGFMAGIVEFLKEEYSVALDLEKLIIEREKQMILGKDKDGRTKCFINYVKRSSSLTTAGTIEEGDGE
ncbi:MAG: hypothetical protein ABSH41_19710 [Syntrophobacteraceae bacterium]|jgi:hypothetical protein